MRLTWTDKGDKNLFVSKPDVALFDRVRDKINMAAMYFGMEEQAQAANELIERILREASDDDEPVRDEDPCVEDGVEEGGSVEPGDEVYGVPDGDIPV